MLDLNMQNWQKRAFWQIRKVCLDSSLFLSLYGPLVIVLEFIVLILEFM